MRLKSHLIVSIVTHLLHIQHPDMIMLQQRSARVLQAQSSPLCLLDASSLRPNDLGSPQQCETFDNLPT